MVNRVEFRLFALLRIHAPVECKKDCDLPILMKAS